MASRSSPIVLHADQEHSGLRTAVLVSLLFCILLFFFLLQMIWPAISPTGLVDFTFMVACIGSLGLGVAVVWGLEKGLKRVWHSGRAIALDKTGIRVQDGDLPDYSLSWDGHMNHLYWTFVLKGYKRGGRERRVPEKWVCLAMQVQEAEHRLIIYTYVSPKQATSLTAVLDQAHFHEISPADVYRTDARSRYLSMPNRPDKIPPEVLAGKDGKFWLAEQRRWTEGFELSASDFETFMKTVTSNQ